MGSTGVQTGQAIVWVIILLIAPIIGALITSLLNLVTGREIPPILPQVNIQSFGQAFVAMIVLGLIYKTTKTFFIILDAIVIVCLFIVLLIQAYIDKKQLAETQKHVRKVLRSKVDSNLKGKMDLTSLIEVADSMIDVDYFPESMTNKLSDYPRLNRRNQFIKIVSTCLELQGEGKIELDQKEFLIPDIEAKFLKNSYVIVSAISVFLYIASVLLSVFGQM